MPVNNGKVKSVKIIVKNDWRYANKRKIEIKINETQVALVYSKNWSVK